jgi:hypothetical protein
MVFGHEEADRKLTAEDAKMFRRGRSIKGEGRRSQGDGAVRAPALGLIPLFAISGRAIARFLSSFLALRAE